MIDAMAQRIASFLVRKGAAAPDDVDVQVYGLQVILSTSINLTASLLLSLLMGQLPFGVSFLITFILLRRFTGGYHANSYLGCFVSLQAVLFVGFAAQRLYESGMSVVVPYVLTAASAVLIFLLAPIDHENKPSTPASRRKFRFLSRLMTLAMAACTALGLMWESTVGYALGIQMALFATGCLLVVAKIQKKGGASS